MITMNFSRYFQSGIFVDLHYDYTMSFHSNDAANRYLSKMGQPTKDLTGNVYIDYVNPSELEVV